MAASRSLSQRATPERVGSRADKEAERGGLRETKAGGEDGASEGRAAGNQTGIECSRGPAALRETPEWPEARLIDDDRWLPSVHCVAADSIIK